jgi:hypothetical protein
MTIMAGVLEGLILISVPGYSGTLPPGIPVVDLAIAGTRFVPLTDNARAFICRAGAGTGKVEGFHELSEGVARWAGELSQAWKVLYAHCEFHGGEGSHAAIAWHLGLVIFGPRFTRTPRELADPLYKVASRRDMAINAGLRALGIQAAGHVDEFAAIGLDRHRWTSDWGTG